MAEINCLRLGIWLSDFHIELYSCTTKFLLTRGGRSHIVKNQ